MTGVVERERKGWPQAKLKGGHVKRSLPGGFACQSIIA